MFSKSTCSGSSKSSHSRDLSVCYNPDEANTLHCCRDPDERLVHSMADKNIIDVGYMMLQSKDLHQWHE